MRDSQPVERIPKTRNSRPALIEADAYLFDIDGTLLNVSDATHYFAFLNAMRDVFGVDCNLDGVAVHGNTDIGILRAALRMRGISDEEFDGKVARAIVQMCAEVVRNAADIRAVPCPYVCELLQQLRAAGKLLGIVTGNLEPIGWAKLNAAKLRDFFEFGCFSGSMHLADDGPGARLESRIDILQNALLEVRRRRGEDARVCMIGDTPSDIHAARALGIPIVAVATGTFSREQLEQRAPDICVGCCEELVKGSQ